MKQAIPETLVMPRWQHAAWRVVRDIRTIRRYRDLIRYLVRGQRKASVADTALGDLWYLVTPLARILTYYFLIVIVFQRGGNFGHSPFLVITMGVMHYMVFMQTYLNRCHSSGQHRRGRIVDYVKYLRRLRAGSMFGVAVRKL